MAYTVIVLRPARKALEELDDTTYRRVQSAIDQLSENPRPHGCEKMAGEKDHWRIRIGKYRVVYNVEDGRLLVLVIRVAHRREVYR